MRDCTKLWQTAILSNWKELFKYLPIESIIKGNQEEYYKAIANSNIAGSSNEFIEFMLEIINKAVDKMKITQETTQEKIINLIRENPKITQIEMAQKLNLTRDGVSYNIKNLKENGIIERIGLTKNGEWKIKSVNK